LVPNIPVLCDMSTSVASLKILLVDPSPSVIASFASIMTMHEFIGSCSSFLINLIRSSMNIAR
jgi:hypothetical protein